MFANPRYPIALVLILAVVSCDSRRGPPPPPGSSSEDGLRNGMEGDAAEPDSDPAPDMIGMDIETARNTVSTMAKLPHPSRHLLTFEQDGHEMVAIDMHCGSFDYALIFQDGALVKILEPPSEGPWHGETHQDLLDSFAAASPVSTDAFRSGCLEHVQKYWKYREPNPVLIGLALAFPQEDRLSKWDALELSLGDDRDRVEELFGAPTRSHIEGDETLLVYENPPEHGGSYQEVTVWLRDSRVVRVRTEGHWIPG